MRFLNRAIAYILSLALILNISTVAYGTELINSSDEIHSYTVNVSSNESSTSSVTFYEFEGKYYLALDDIKDFTRCTLTEDAETIMLTHGLREIVINKSTGQMVDSGMVDQGNISLLNCNGMYLCEGIPMLRYLGATCSIRDGMIGILMPSFTIWESIMPDYLDYYFNIKELYGGEDNVKISLICDIIADVFDGASGHGLFANADMHLEDALYEILNVDMMKYVSAQDAATTLNQKINDFLASAVFDTALDTSDNTYDAVYDALDYYVKFYVSGKNDILLNTMTKTDDLEYASDLASQIQTQIYSQSAAKANLKSAKTAQSFMDIGMLAFDTAITSYSMMQYDDDTRSLFARTINQEMFKYADYYDISWNNVSDTISNTLKSTQSIVSHTAIDKVTEFAVKKAAEEGAKSAVSAFTSKSNIYAAAAQIGFFVASLINYESNQAYSADMNAIWLSAVQYDIAMLASSLLVKERDEFHFSNVESLEKLKDMFTLYYRTTIAFSENIALSIKEFGSKEGKKWVEWFSSTNGVSVANYTADYLYKITNCTIVPIVDFSAISDDVITYDWISNSHSGKVELSQNDQDNITNTYPNMPNQFFCITVSGRSNWVINPKANGFFSGTFTSSDWGDQGPDYPNGTCYITEISGQFSSIEKINEHTYRMIADSIKKTAQAGETYISENVRYVVEEGTCINNGDEFYLYLPGVSYAEFPQGLIDSVNNNGYHSLDEITRDSYILYNPDPEASGYEFVFIGEIGIMPTNLPQSINQYDLRELTSFKLNGFWHSTDGQYVYQIFTSEYDSVLTNTLHYVDLNGSDDVKAGKVIQTSSYSIKLKTNEDRGVQFEVFAVDSKLRSDEITLVRTDDYTTGRILGTWQNEDWSYTFEADGTYSVDRARGESYWGYYFVIDSSRIVMSEYASESELRDYRIDDVGLWIDNMDVLVR